MISFRAEASRSTVPGPPGLPLLGALPQVRKDPLQFLSRMVREYGDVVCLGGVGDKKFFLVTHPRDVEHVWKTITATTSRAPISSSCGRSPGAVCSSTRGSPGAPS